VSANSLPYIVPILLCLIGFHGLFFYDNLARKTAAWALFQVGTVLLLFQLTSAAGPVPRVLVLEAAALGFSVTLLLGVLCLKLWKKNKTLQGDEIAKRVK